MSAQETADYVRTHLIELEHLSDAAGLKTLAYLIHLATFEAENVLEIKRASECMVALMSRNG